METTDTETPSKGNSDWPNLEITALILLKDLILMNKLFHAVTVVLIMLIN